RRRPPAASRAARDDACAVVHAARAPERAEQHPASHVCDPRGCGVGLHERGPLVPSEPDVPADTPLDRQPRPDVGVLVPADLRGPRPRSGLHPPRRAHARGRPGQRTRALTVMALPARSEPVHLGVQSLTIETAIDHLVEAAQGVVENQLELAKLEVELTASRVLGATAVILVGVILLFGAVAALAMTAYVMLPELPPAQR